LIESPFNNYDLGTPASLKMKYSWQSAIGQIAII
jgi:hypothetical protein